MTLLTRSPAHRAMRALARRRRGISNRHRPSLRRPISQGCTYDQVVSDEYLAWTSRLGIPPLRHRKLWEWCFILQALSVYGAVVPGRRGVGFGVGKEPIAAWLAAYGCNLLATDLCDKASEATEWRETGQHASCLDDLDHPQICPSERFREHVAFRPVDMSAIPADVRGYDFCWSSCAMEHLGDLEAGLQFFEEQLRCLRPGGIGVHTTEYNLSSNDETLSEGDTVLYRRCDLEGLVTRMRANGHSMRVTFALGARREDLHVDVEPFTDTHLRTRTGDFVNTSFGLIVKKAHDDASEL